MNYYGAQDCIVLPNGHVLVATGGGIFKSTDRGQYWRQSNVGLDEPNSRAVSALHHAPSGWTFLAAMDGVHRSSNGGDSWVRTGAGLDTVLRRIYALGSDSSGSIYVAGTNWLYRSDDNGDVWNFLNLDVAGPRSIVCDRNGTVYVKYASSVHRLINKGSSSQQVASTPYTNFGKLAVSPGNDLFVSNGFGGVLRAEASEATWVKANVGLINTFVSVLRADSSGSLYAGVYGEVFKSSDMGLSWNALGDLHSGQLCTDIALAPNGELYAACGYLARSTNDGISWSHVGLSLARSVAVSPRNTIIAGFGKGIYRSTDQGATWQETWSSADAYNGVRPIIAHRSGLIIAGTQFDGVLKSIDDGVTWISSGFADAVLSCVTISDDGIMIVASDLDIFRSTDLGATWVKSYRGIAAMDFAHGSPGEVYATHFPTSATAPAVFRSTDYGLSWSEITTGLPRTIHDAVTTHHSGAVFVGTQGDGVFINTSWMRRLNAPALLSPRLGDESVPVRTRLTWSKTNSASWYRLHLSTDPVFEHLVVDTVVVGDTSAFVTMLRCNSTYYARVRAGSAVDSSGWSVTLRFSTTPYFVCPARTGNNATVAIPQTVAATVGRGALSAGDEIGAFDAVGRCVGASVWRQANGVLVVWGDDSQTDTLDGMGEGAPFHLRVWQKSTGRVFETVRVHFSEGSAIFHANGIRAIDSLTALPSFSITVVPSVLDFGDVVTGRSRDTVAIMMNDAQSMDSACAILTGLSQPFMNVTGDSVLVIAPGQSAAVRLRFSPQAIGTFRDTLVAIDDLTGGSYQCIVAGRGIPVTSLAATDLAVPAMYYCCQNYPNPFNASTTLVFGLPAASRVSVAVYNTIGQLVQTNAAADVAAGVYALTVDAGQLPSGAYLCVLRARATDRQGVLASSSTNWDYTSTIKMLLIR